MSSSESPDASLPGGDGGGPVREGPSSGAPSRGSRPAPPPEEEISLLALLNVFLRHRRAILAATLGVAFLVVAVTLVMPRTYSATTSFTPQAAGEDQRARLAGLAGQFGINIPTGEVGQSPQFYADLLRSRELLRETIETEYRFTPEGAAEPREGDLVELLDVREDRRPLAVAKAVERMRDDIVSVSTNAETGVVELSVTTRWPALSRQVAERMVELVNRFNLERRQTQGAAEREFIEEQLREAEQALLAAEDSLEAFLERNRRYEGSPELRFQFERLQRRVSLRQEVFTSLSQSYEEARIQEVRNTPVITVVEPAEEPARPDSRRLALKGILGLLLGGMLGTFWAFGREMLVTSRQRDPDDYAEFARLKAETVEGVRRLAGRLKVPGAGSPDGGGPDGARTGAGDGAGAGGSGDRDDAGEAVDPARRDDS